MTRTALFITCLAAAMATSIQAKQTPSRVNLSGQLFFTAEPPAGFKVTSVDLMLTPMSDPAGIVKAQVRSDGSFTLPDVTVGGRYRVNPIPSDVMYLANGVYGKDDALCGPIEIRVGEALQLLVLFELGRVDALVMDQDKPLMGATGVLVPNKRCRADLYRAAATDQNGKIAFLNLAPGDYKLFAWANVKVDAWQDEAFMKPFEDRGRPIHVGKSGNVAETIQVLR